MKTGKIHELNTKCNFVSDKNFSSAVCMVGLETGIGDVERNEFGNWTVECGNLSKLTVECNEFGNWTVECNEFGNWTVECNEFGNWTVECGNLSKFVVECNELNNDFIIEREVNLLGEIISRQSLIANDMGKMILN